MKLSRTGVVPDSYTVTPDKTMLMPGESAVLDIAYYEAGVNRVELSDIGATFEPQNMLKFDADSKTVTALDVTAAADVKVTINGKHNGEDVSASCNITVAPLAEDYIKRRDLYEQKV